MLLLLIVYTCSSRQTEDYIHGILVFAFRHIYVYVIAYFVSVVSVSFEEANYFVLESSPSSFDVCVVISAIIERNVEVTVTAVELTAQSEHDNSFNYVCGICRNRNQHVRLTTYLYSYLRWRFSFCSLLHHLLCWWCHAAVSASLSHD